MARRKRKKNPVGWGDGIGAALSVAVPTVAFMTGGEVASGLLVVGGLIGGALGAWSNGFRTSSISRGYAAGSFTMIAAGVVMTLSQRRAPSSGGATQVGAFPNIQVGTRVLIDTAVANFPQAGAFPQLVATVDMILSDPNLVSVAGIQPDGTVFRGTISRGAILTVLPPLFNA